jgi:hypothetical protein
MSPCCVALAWHHQLGIEHYLGHQRESFREFRESIRK